MFVSEQTDWSGSAGVPHFSPILGEVGKCAYSRRMLALVPRAPSSAKSSIRARLSAVPQAAQNDPGFSRGVRGAHFSPVLGEV